MVTVMNGTIDDPVERVKPFLTLDFSRRCLTGRETLTSSY
jgi:hypothetical protein